MRIKINATVGESEGADSYCFLINFIIHEGTERVSLNLTARQSG